MKRWLLAAALVAAALVLGATVFAQPVALAAQAIGATIVGPLDEQGNVKVSQAPVVTKLVATEVLNNEERFTIDVSPYGQVRVAVGDMGTCDTTDHLNVFVVEGGKITFRLDRMDYCGGEEAALFDMPGTTLQIECDCPGPGRLAEVLVWGRPN
jgi:hypothetical protein